MVVCACFVCLIVPACVCLREQLERGTITPRLLSILYQERLCCKSQACINTHTHAQASTHLHCLLNLHTYTCAHMHKHPPTSTACSIYTHTYAHTCTSIHPPPLLAQPTHLHTRTHAQASTHLHCLLNLHTYIRTHMHKHPPTSTACSFPALSTPVMEPPMRPAAYAKSMEGYLALRKRAHTRAGFVHNLSC